MSHQENSFLVGSSTDDANLTWHNYNIMRTFYKFIYIQQNYNTLSTGKNVGGDDGTQSKHPNSHIHPILFLHYIWPK